MLQTALRHAETLVGCDASNLAYQRRASAAAAKSCYAFNVSNRLTLKWKRLTPKSAIALALRLVELFASKTLRRNALPSFAASLAHGQANQSQRKYKPAWDLITQVVPAVVERHKDE